MCQKWKLKHKWKWVEELCLFSLGSKQQLNLRPIYLPNNEYRHYNQGPNHCMLVPCSLGREFTE